MRRLLPRSLSGQIVMLVMLTFLLSQLLSWVWLYLDGVSRSEEFTMRTQTRAVAAVTRLFVNISEIEERQVLLEAVQKTYPLLHFGLAADDLVANGVSPWLTELETDLGPGFTVRATDDAARIEWKPTPIVITLPDGQHLLATVLLGPRKATALPASLVVSVFASLALVLSLIWVARTVSGQLARFARAAAEFDPESESRPVEEVGPSELRTLARAFNRMRDRITALVTNHTLMFTAVGHDLRTPVTRLRLRAESIPDPQMRAAFVRDIDYVSSLISDVVGLLRKEEAEPFEPLDLSALLRTIRDDFHDLGFPVSYHGPERCIVRGRADDLRRMISNLVENATRFGDQVIISLSQQDDSGTLTIGVDDNGPGIPLHERELMMQPFVTGDKARTGKSLGLGLAIASGIAAAHHARIRLGESSLGGLRVAVSLPQQRGANTPPDERVLSKAG
jgi:signal transduction histidine kinase